MYKNIKPLFFFKSLQIVKYIEKKSINTVLWIK